MKDTIEVPVELVKKLYAYADEWPVGCEDEMSPMALIRQLPRPDPALERCPFCGGGRARCGRRRRSKESDVRMVQHAGMRGPVTTPVVRSTTPWHDRRGCCGSLWRSYKRMGMTPSMRLFAPCVKGVFEMKPFDLAPEAEIEIRVKVGHRTCVVKRVVQDTKYYRSNKTALLLDALDRASEEMARALVGGTNETV